MDLLVRDADLVLLDPRRPPLRGASVLIEGGVVVEAGRGVEAPRGVDVLEAKGRAVVPGLVNMHTHSVQAAMRGLLDGLPLAAWLRESDRLYGALGGEEAWAAAVLFYADSLLCGATSVLDMERDVEAAARAAADTGIRLYAAYAMVDTVETGRSGLERLWSVEEELSRARSLAGRRWRGRVELLYGPVGYPSSSFDLMEAAAAEARERGLRVHIHLAETPVNDRLARLQGYRGEYEELEARGVLGPWLSAAHGVHLDGYALAGLAKYGATLVHCPSSNAKLGNGVAPAWEALRGGVNVALGTDGPASGDSASMLWEMRAASLIQRAALSSPRPISAAEALAMATVNAGRALGRRLGALRPGWAGDLVVLDLGDPSLQPVDSLVENLVFSASCRAVEAVVVGGEVVVEGGRLARAGALQQAYRVLRDARERLVGERDAAQG